MRKSLWAAGAAVALISTAALATVTFDPVTGTGFVGKGDVQIAFGWNNKAAQDNANKVSFTYNVNDVYDVTCEWETTTGGPHPQTIVHDVTVPRHIHVNAAVAYDARLKNQYTGYNLLGFGSEVDDATPPQVGDACPGQSNVGAIVTVVEQTGSSSGLFVTFNGNSVQIY